MAKKRTSETTTPTKKSATKPLAILVLGLAGALAIAAFLTSGSAEEASGELSLGAVAADTARVRGPEDAVVTLTEFGDYQCPTCGTFHPIVAQMLQRFPDDLKLEYHHFPLISIHPNALPAAKAAEAAAESGRFWEMHDMLFNFQFAWSGAPDPETLFVSYAERLGIDRNAFLTAYRSKTIEERVLADVALGREMGINGTPTFFVNGQEIGLPRSAAEFESVIQEAIANAQ